MSEKIPDHVCACECSAVLQQALELHLGACRQVSKSLRGALDTAATRLAAQA